MRTLVNLNLLLLFAITLVHAQPEHPLTIIKTAYIQKNNAVINGLSLSKVGDKKSMISLNPLNSNSTSTLNLTALIQGFYNGSVMSSVNPIVVKVELHDATTMDGIESQIGTLSSTGVGTFSFSSAVDGIPYFIVVKYSNTIETWSSTPHAFSSGTLFYDFTSAAAQAYGNNLILNGTKYCIYSGDVNQDGLVDLSDLITIDNDIVNNVTGNVNTDVNGDGKVDLSDIILVANNNINYVSQKAPPGVPSETLDYDGQTYHTILIGTQYWLKENLNVGTKIIGSTEQSNNGLIEKYCYNNLVTNCIKYGGLYQWNESMQYSTSGGNIQGICPSGWHIPSDVEQSNLSSSASGNGNSLKAVGQGVGGGAGSDASGFSGLLSGYRLYNAGTFSDLGIEGDGYFWSSTQYIGTNAILMSLTGFDSNILLYSALQGYGFSVRCVKNGWLLLQSPNGGESWQVGSNQNITWKNNNITNAKIDFTTNDGINWTTIISSTSASAGSYNWSIPNTPSTSCRIRLNDASDTTIKSISSSLFTIWIPTILLSSPNGGEIWKVDEIDSIKWTSSNITNAKIEFSTDNGINWTSIVGSIPASIGYYPWTIPSTISANCLVRISDVSDTNIKSISSNIFTISNPPCPGVEKVIYNGQTYNTVQIGSQCWLKENLNIGIPINGLQEQTDNTIIEKYCYNNDPANCIIYGGLYQWAEAVQYKNGATNTTSPSPAFYGHVQGICPTGWHLPDTSEYSILANTVYNDGNSLKAVGQGSGSGAGTDLSGFSALLAGTRYSDGSFSLLGLFNFFGSSTEEDTRNIYYVDLGAGDSFIYLVNNVKNYGRSFRCIKDGSLLLQLPNGGESWQVGSIQNITWKSSYITNVKIEYSTDNGTNWITIISYTPSSGSYLWTIPNTPSTNCKVRISDVLDITINSLSASIFTISN